jgi:hypothetical protein
MNKKILHKIKTGGAWANFLNPFSKQKNAVWLTVRMLGERKKKLNCVNLWVRSVF